MTKDIANYISILRLKDAETTLNFWYFYFDCPHPESYKRDYQQLYSDIQRMAPEISEIMKQSYEQLLSEYDGHAH